MNNEIIFIYSKGSQIKVLNLENAKKNHNEMISNGWRHNSSFNAIMVIERLCNLSDSEIINAVNELKIKCERPSPPSGYR